MTQKLIEQLAANDEGHRRRDPGRTTTRTRRSSPRRPPKRASHILFKADGQGDGRRRSSSRAQGRRATSPQLAKKYSVDTATAAKGGDLGWPTARRYVPEFQAALDKLDKGEISALVQTTVRLAHHHGDRRRARPRSRRSPRSRTQIKQIIVQQRKAEAYQKFLDELRKKAKIEILLEDLKAGAGKKALDRHDRLQVARQRAAGRGSRGTWVRRVR